MNSIRVQPRRAANFLCAAAVLFFIANLFACAGTGTAAAASGILEENEPQAADTPRYLYDVEIDSQRAGFSLIVNGTELVFYEGASGAASGANNGGANNGGANNGGANNGGAYSASIPLNDWMISGENAFSLNILPQGRISGNSLDIVLKRQTVPGIGEPETSGVWAFHWPEEGSTTALTGSFSAAAFPAVLLEKAEKVSGALTRDDSREITAVVQQLRQAFSAKDLAAINALMETKYADVAAARFLPPEQYRAEMNAFYAGLTARPDFAVRTISSNLTFLSTADDRLVKVMQGLGAVTQPAIMLEYTGDNGRKTTYVHDLYFAKLDGRWVILR